MGIIPLPVEVSEGRGEPFVLSASTRIVADAALDGQVAWFTERLQALTGTVLNLAEQDESTISLAVEPDSDAFAGLPVTGGVRADDGDHSGERYRLEIDAPGVSVTAPAAEGVFRGLTTLLQLAATAAVEDDGPISLAPVEVRDAPRFAWRGLSFDVVRSAFPVADVKRMIDLLALYKLNVLHLHLTDSEGWRIEIDSWPKLTEVGGKTAARGRPGGFYTKQDFAEIVRYAAERFITIVPEIEMPGHSAAIFQSYPELAGDGTEPPEVTIEKAYDFQAMHPDNPRIVPFLTDVLAEVAAMTPGARIHIGGDEALGMDEERYRRFMQQAMPIVKGLGKKVVAWQEAVRAGLEPGDIAQLWVSPGQGQELPEIKPGELPEGFEIPTDLEQLLAAFAEFLALAQADLDTALEQGVQILVSQQSRCYLDTKYREASSDPAQAADRLRLGMLANPKSTVDEFYDWDPATIRPQLREEAIAGVEAAIWCESVESIDDLGFLVLPRLPGIAEKGWSAAAGGDAWVGYRPRLASHDAIWERVGWPYFRSSVVWDSPDQ